MMAVHGLTRNYHINKCASDQVQWPQKCWLWGLCDLLSLIFWYCNAAYKYISLHHLNDVDWIHSECSDSDNNCFWRIYMVNYKECTHRLLWYYMNIEQPNQLDYYVIKVLHNNSVCIPVRSTGWRVFIDWIRWTNCSA